MRRTDSTPRSLPWISRLVALDTTSRDSNLPLIELVAAELADLGVEVAIRPSPAGDKANLVATIPDGQGRRTGGVVLSGHTDVVPVDGQRWTSDPFTPHVRDGRVYGRGTCDMKGFLGVVLTAVPDLLAADLPEPVHLALSYDEEVGCLGGAQIVKDIAELGLAPRVCVVGEPTGMGVVVAHKSMTVVEVTVTGVAAHSSLTRDGVNAIEYAAPLIVAVRDLADRWATHGPADEGFALPYSTASVNVIAGGIAENTVPDRCAFRFEFRAIPAVDPGDVVEEVRGRAREVEATMRARDPRASVDVDVRSFVPALDPAGTGAAADLAGALVGSDTVSKVMYGTEAGLFAGAGIPAVVCGPGDIAVAHRADEYLTFDQIRACEDAIAALARPR